MSKTPREVIDECRDALTDVWKRGGIDRLMKASIAIADVAEELLDRCNLADDKLEQVTFERDTLAARVKELEAALSGIAGWLYEGTPDSIHSATIKAMTLNGRQCNE